MQEGKWENVHNVYDHLNKDVEDRVGRMNNRIVAIDENLYKKRNDIIKPNEKSTNILANKFRDEFI